MARILVIDDEEMVRLAVMWALEQVGHTVIEAVDGNDGLVKYRQGSVDLVITDILMPGKEGISTIRAFRGMTRDLPIIVMSGGLRKAGPGLLDEATELGANASLKKPFRIAEVRQAVNAQLGWPSPRQTCSLPSVASAKPSDADATACD